MPDEPVLLTVSEAAALLRIGRNTCYQLARERRIPVVRLGRRLLVPRARLLEWLENEASALPEPEVLRFPP